MPKRILEGATPKERALKRQKLGSLQSLTVQPSTRLRYDAAVQDFFKFLTHNSLELPTKRDLMDGLVCEYIEFLWSSGAGRAKASDTVAGLQDATPKLRGCLPGAWRLLKTWAINEVPNRAPPFPEHVVHALCGWACFHQHFGFAVSLLVGFYGMLRTGELFNIRRKDFLSQPGHRTVLLSLGLTKGGKRVGAAESVVLGHDAVVKPLQQWMLKASLNTPLTQSPGAWRSLFNKGLESLKITSHGFRPYSLRRGGATWWFGKHHSLDRILVQGRWQAAKTARIYINEGLAILAQLQIGVRDKRLVSFLSVYSSQLKNPTFATLEPPANAGRSGGRGKGKGRQSFRAKNHSRKRLVSILSFSGSFRIVGVARSEEGKPRSFLPI